MKKCPHCKETKPKTDFYCRSARPDLLNSWCKKCENTNMRKLRAAYPAKYKAIDARWRAKNLERHRESARQFLLRNPGYTHMSGIRRNYGMTLQQYNALLAAQNGKCAICETDSPGGRGKRFHVDHCHETNVVRGLLCHRCNTGVGLLQDDPALLGRAIQYLVDSNTQLIKE